MGLFDIAGPLVNSFQSMKDQLQKSQDPKSQTILGHLNSIGPTLSLLNPFHGSSPAPVPPQPSANQPLSSTWGSSLASKLQVPLPPPSPEVQNNVDQVQPSLSMFGRPSMEIKLDQQLQQPSLSFGSTPLKQPTPGANWPGGYPGAQNPALQSNLDSLHEHVNTPSTGYSALMQPKFPNTQLRAPTPQESAAGALPFSKFDVQGTLDQMSQQNDKFVQDYQQQQTAKLSPLDQKIKAIIDPITGGAKTGIQAAGLGLMQGLTGWNANKLYDFNPDWNTPTGFATNLVHSAGNLGGMVLGFMATDAVLKPVLGPLFAQIPKVLGTAAQAIVHSPAISDEVATTVLKYIPKVVDLLDKAAPTIGSMTRAGANFTLLNQVQGFVRGDSLQQHLASIPGSMLQGAIFDIALGTLTGEGASSVTSAITKSVTVGSFFGLASKLQGASNQQAVVDGVLMGGLTLFGLLPEGKMTFSTDEAFSVARKELGMPEPEGAKPGQNPTPADPQQVQQLFLQKAEGLNPNSVAYQKLEFARAAVLFPDRLVGLHGLTQAMQNGKLTSLNTPQGELPRPGVNTPAPLPDLTTRVLDALGDRKTVSRQFIEDLTNKPDLKQPERDLIRSKLAEFKGDTIDVKKFADSVRTDLLPLDRIKSDMNGPSGKVGAKYENITLPPEVRGPVQNYSEHIYQSPIKTSAGDIHFGESLAPNYFAHTRVEDTPDNTRRAIEVQSDLFQKGNLEKESRSGKGLPSADEYAKAMGLYKPGTSELKSNIPPTNADLIAYKKILAEQKPISKLEPYRNTWHERIIREEVKQAAKDGKTKIQFPTGETAMQIEGLGQRNGWFNSTPRGELGTSRYGELKIADLKEGLDIHRGGVNGNWVITDVAGDTGIFRAVPRDKIYDIRRALERPGNTLIPKKILDSEVFRQANKTPFAEQFDIGDTIDKNNPIYKFYEKEVGRFLKREYPDMQRITDKQGVEWYQVDTTPKAGKLSYAQKPTLAFHEQPQEGGIPEEARAKAELQKQESLPKDWNEIEKDRVPLVSEGDSVPPVSEADRIAYEHGVLDQLKAEQLVDAVKRFTPDTIKLFNKLRQVALRNKELTSGDVETARRLYPEKTEKAIQAYREALPEDAHLSDNEVYQRIINEIPTIAAAKTADAYFKKVETALHEYIKNTPTIDQERLDTLIKPLLTKAEYQRALQDFLQQVEDLPHLPPDKKIIGLSEMIAKGLSNYKDIYGFLTQHGDVYRNFERFFGEDFPEIRKMILDPFDKAKGDMFRDMEQISNELDKEVVEKLGIKNDSPESAMVQKWGEGLKSDTAVQVEFGEKFLLKAMRADSWIRTEYKQLIFRVNNIRRAIYPTRPDKLVPMRKNYYRHFHEFPNFLKDIKAAILSPSAISPELSGTSQFTEPKSKWASFMQRRLGTATKYDAVGGFLNYLPSALYAIHIDPQIARFRELAKALVMATNDRSKPETYAKANNFIEFLVDYANDLAGKTNPADRYMTKHIPGGRSTVRVLNIFNRRVKANAVLGNFSVALAQFANMPHVVADVGPELTLRGAVRALASIFQTNTPMDQSDFMKERNAHGMFGKFDRGFIQKAKTIAGLITSSGDRVVSRFIWNMEYEKALADGRPNPVRYADYQARKMLAGRGIGEVPLFQKATKTQLYYPFQVEVSNAVNVITDIMAGRSGETAFGQAPITMHEEGEGEDKHYTVERDNNWKKAIKLVELFVSISMVSYLLNKIRGSGVGMDLLGAIYEGGQILAQDGLKKGALPAGGRVAGEILKNLPVGQTLASWWPEFGGTIWGTSLKVPTRAKLFGAGDPTRYGTGTPLAQAFMDPVFKLFPAFGGSQLKKVYQAVQAFENHGIPKGAAGKNIAGFNPITPDPMNIVRALLFGPYATSQGQAYTDKQNGVKTPAPGSGSFNGLPPVLDQNGTNLRGLKL